MSNPADVLAEDLALGLGGEIVKYAEVAAMLAGETAIQGAAPNPESDGVLIRNVDNNAFDTRIAPPRVASIGSFGGAALSSLLAGMANGRYDAWIVHLAEGVRDGDRRAGDPVSSRAEFATLLLYGEMANVYDALAEGVLVLLGTDWTPSGSRTLLHELKVADVALRDVRLLGESREEIPAFAVDRKQARQAARRGGA